MPKPITNLKEISEGRSDLHRIDPRVIVDIPGLNERVDYGDLAQLKEQIRIHGVLIELVIKLKDGKIGLVEGYRRMRCVRELIAERTWTHGNVPVKAEDRSASERDRLIRQIVGNQGKPYTILEEGRVFERLISGGMSKVEAGEATGKSRTHVANALSLAAAPPRILELVIKGSISESLVIDLIRESKGDNEKLVADVESAIGTAKSSGKKKATKKHTTKAKEKKKKEEPAAPAPAAPAPAPSAPSGETPATWSGGGGGGGGGGSDRTSHDTTANLTKLNKAMEEIDRKDCDDKCYDTIEAVIDFLEGSKTLSELKKFIRK